MLKTLLFTLLFSCFAPQLALGTPIRYSDKGLSSLQKQQARAFLTEVNGLLPETLKSNLGKKNIVRFRDLNRGQPLLPPNCGSNTAGEKAVPVVLGRHSEFNGKITLDSQLLFQYAQGDNVKYSCGHGNLRRRALAAAVHEFLHAYDESAGERASNDRGGSQFLRKISDDLVFKGKTMWKPVEYSVRVPDVYEKTNIKEYAAVNFEYFLLDPTYKCRRPQVYDYFSKEFSVKPNSRHRCQSISKLVVTRQTDPYLESFDPSRLYEIQYLLASSGDGLQSRYGHSMVRLVICAPWRKKRSAACRSDFESHLVASFRANVNDIMINGLKGIFGGYHSIMFIIPLNEVISEYNDKELRNLYGYPIQFNRTQLNKFSEYLLSTHWGYEGDYKFINNNCATETRDLIVSIFDEPKYFSDETITPRGVRDSLIRMGLINPKNKKVLPLTSVLRSREEAMIKSYKNIFSDSNVDRKTITQYMDQSPRSRARVLENLSDYKSVLSFTVLETQASLYRSHKKQKDLAKQIHKKAERKVEASSRVQKYLRDFTRTQQAFASGGYGIPQGREAQKIAQVLKGSERRSSAIRDVLAEIGISLSDFDSEISQIEANIKNARAKAETLR